MVALLNSVVICKDFHTFVSYIFSETVISRHASRNVTHNSGSIEEYVRKSQIQTGFVQFSRCKYSGLLTSQLAKLVRE